MKKLILLTVALITALSLTACGCASTKGSEETTTSATSASSTASDNSTAETTPPSNYYEDETINSYEIYWD